MSAIKSKSRRPSRPARSAIYAACQQRGRPSQNIWLVYSGRCSARKVLGSDTEYLHFLATEFDPLVRDVEWRPDPIVVNVDGEQRSVTFEAIVHLRDGVIECRQVRRDAPEPLPAGVETLESRAISRAAAQRGGKVRMVSSQDMAPLGYRIQNSLRMLRFMASAASYNLGPLTNDVSRVLKRERQISLRDLMQELGQGRQALVLAATFGLVQRGTLVMDLDFAFATFDSLVQRAA